MPEVRDSAIGTNEEVEAKTGNFDVAWRRTAAAVNKLSQKDPLLEYAKVLLIQGSSSTLSNCVFRT